MATDVTSDKTKGGCLAAVILVGAICLCYAGCVIDGPESSTGYRDGRVQKLTRKGLLRKSWEGEMALPGLKVGGDGNGRIGGSVWPFSVDDERREVLDALEDVRPEETVRLHYSQRLWVSPWSHDTKYRVTRVERLKQSKSKE